MTAAPATLVIPDRAPEARAILDAHFDIIKDLALDPTPWEWWADHWTRNGWTIIQTDTIVHIEKSDDHPRDRRHAEFGIACRPPERLPSGEAAVRHALDMIRDVVLHVDRDDERRADAWLLALAATRHPCGSKPGLVRLPSPFQTGLSQLEHQRDDQPPPEGEIAEMLAAAPTTLSWAAGGSSGHGEGWMSISGVERLCGSEYEIDPDADPIAMLRAIERVKAEMEKRPRPGRA